MKNDMTSEIFWDIYRTLVCGVALMAKLPAYDAVSTLVLMPPSKDMAGKGA